MPTSFAENLIPDSQPSARRGILRTRLFGYAVLFRARQQTGGGIFPVDVTPADEASALARELELHVGEGSAPDAPGQGESEEVGISVPFGRCGIAGRPLEHVRFYHVEQAWVDSLSVDGPRTRAVPEGETVLVEPGGFVRFRAVPRTGGRALIAFQTEDRSPLSGHAAALTTSGQTVPLEAGPRLIQTTAAFDSMRADGEAAQARLPELFAQMASAVGENADVAGAQQAARDAGSYDAGPASVLFDDAKALLTPDIIGRIRAGDEEFFRFPGMFGAVAPLFPLLES